jgi:hypothetical protein
MKKNENAIAGQPFEETGNPLYSLPFRMPPIWKEGVDDESEVHREGADGDSEKQWAQMAAAMGEPGQMQQLLPLGLFATATDSWIRETARDRWNVRCNAAFQCGLRHRDLEPGSRVPTDFAQRWLRGSEGRAQSVKREIESIHGRLMGIRKRQERHMKGEDHLDSKKLEALRRMYNHVIHLTDPGVVGIGKLKLLP